MSKLVYTKGKEYHIGVGAGDVGRYVILPGDPGRCEKIAKHFDNPVKIAQNREYTTWVGEIEGEPVYTPAISTEKKSALSPPESADRPPPLRSKSLSTAVRTPSSVLGHPAACRKKCSAEIS